MILDDVAVAVLLIEFVVVPPIILLLTVAAWPDAVFNLIPQKIDDPVVLLVTVILPILLSEILVKLELKL